MPFAEDQQQNYRQYHNGSSRITENHAEANFFRRPGANSGSNQHEPDKEYADNEFLHIYPVYSFIHYFYVRIK